MAEDRRFLGEPARKRLCSVDSMSVNGTKRTYQDDLLLVRFRATADIHARVASTASVVNDPQRSLTAERLQLHALDHGDGHAGDRAAENRLGGTMSR
jgi:hypothetical protein